MFLHGLSDDPTTSATAGASSTLDQAIGTFLAATPQPAASDVAGFLKTFDAGDARNAAAQALIAQGVDIETVGRALYRLDASSSGDGGMGYLMGVLTLGAAAGGAYHGYRRNQSVGWAVGWFAMGLIFPLFTTALAVGEGFGKRKGT